MECDFIKENFDLYTDDDSITDFQREQIKTHLENCESCRNEYLIYKEMIDEVKNIQPLELPQNFHAELMQSINKAARQKVFPWNKLASMVAGFLVVIVSVSAMSSFSDYDKNSSKDTASQQINNAGDVTTAGTSLFTEVETTAAAAMTDLITDTIMEETKAAMTEASVSGIEGEQVHDSGYNEKGKQAEDFYLLQDAAEQSSEEQPPDISQGSTMQSPINEIADADDSIAIPRDSVQQYNVSSKTQIRIGSISDTVSVSYYFQLNTADFDTAFDYIQALAKEHSGIIKNTSQYDFSSDGTGKSGSITIIIPKQAVENIESALAELGNIVSSSTYTDDYGLILTETQSTLSSKLAEKEALTKAIADADSQNIVAYNALLSEVNSTISSCYSILESIQNSCDYSIIDISIISNYE